MFKVLRAASIALAMGGAAPAWGQVAVDVKAGYSFPMGDIEAKDATLTATFPMSSTWSGAIPLEVAVRWRFDAHVSAGVYFQWNPAFVGGSPALAETTSCGTGLGCSAYDMRLGLQVVYAVLPGGVVDPWFSVGTGWEWTSYTVPLGTHTLGATWNGWEVVNVQAGLDVAVAREFAVGPWVGWFGGIYSNSSFRGYPVPLGGSVEPSRRTFHSWLQLGLKGTFFL